MPPARRCPQMRPSRWGWRRHPTALNEGVERVAGVHIAEREGQAVVVHILAASVYAILGAFQFAPAFRRHRPGSHRVAGRLLVAGGLLVGLSGLWMTLFYPHAPGTMALLYAVRLLFRSVMVGSIVCGF